jgi:hypothetical protein
MNHDNDFDDLDRALMALPLEEPPAGLRDSILAATIYAPPSVPALALHTWEIVIVGTVLAIGSWLGFLLAQNPALNARVASLIGGFLTAFADPATLIWLACGAIVVVLYNVVPQRLGLAVRSGRS